MKLIDFDVNILHQTDGAVLVDHEGVNIWLAKSQVAVYVSDRTDTTHLITVPEWLAIEKEMI